MPTCSSALSGRRQRLRRLCGLALVAVTVACVRQGPGPGSSAPHSYEPPEGFVPDSSTATRIAEAVWIPIYGEEQIRNQRPYRAALQGASWVVRGSLPPGQPGGVAVAEIARSDGRILRVSHGR